MISGGPYLAMASFKASTQKSACIVLLNRQLRTLRVAKSMIATRYKNPFRTGTKVRGTPDLARALYHHLSQQVREDWMLGVRLAGSGSFLDRL